MNLSKGYMGILHNSCCNFSVKLKLYSYKGIYEYMKLSIFSLGGKVFQALVNDNCAEVGAGE